MEVISRLINDAGQTYFLKIATDNPGLLVRELWQSLPDRYHCGPQTNEAALGEWTDRMRDFRTTVSGNEVCIRTHAWHPQGDKTELHPDVASFLQGKGIDMPRRILTLEQKREQAGIVDSPSRT